MKLQFPSPEEIKLLLNSPDMEQYEQLVADQVGLALLPYALDVLPRMQRELYLAGLSTEEARNILSSNKKQLVEFSLGIMRAPGLDEEYPVGEEPDSEDLDETIQILGLSKGFGATHICFYKLASEAQASSLLTFLLRTRIPNRQKFCSTLRKLHRGIHSG